MTPKEEYTLYQNSNPQTLTTPIRNGKTINWLKAWDYRAGLTEYTFKTLMPPPYESPNIKSVEQDLRPGINMVFYIITIKR